MTCRLFVGIELDEPVAGRRPPTLAGSQTRLTDVAPRFRGPLDPAPNLHITFWFLGEVAEMPRRR